MTLALMSLSPIARATETRWWPSLDEVQVADPEDVDRRHRLAALARLGDPLPAPAGARGGAEGAVELAAAAVDGADDRVERDHLLADVVRGCRAERGDDLLERAACARRRRARSAAATPAATRTRRRRSLSKAIFASSRGWPVLDLAPRFRPGVESRSPSVTTVLAPLRPCGA